MVTSAVDGTTLPERWSTASSRYQERMGKATSHATARIVQYVNTFAPLKEDSYCLDVGTGGGSIPIRIRDVAPAGTKILATDISPGMLESVDALKLPNVKTQQEDALQLAGLEDDTFSHVFTSFAIQFTSDPATTVQQMHRVLKPGGMAGIVVWGDYHGLADIHDRACRLINPHYKPVSPYTPSAWTSKAVHHQQMEAAGFKDVDTDVVLLPWHCASGHDFGEYWFTFPNPVTEKLLVNAEQQGISREKLREVAEKLVDDEYEQGKGIYCNATCGWGTK